MHFEFIRPSHTRRTQDSDLDQPVPQTHEIYSVRNTPEPLKLKVIRHVPCLCPPCIKEEGTCLNASHTDPWRTVKLIPEKGANLRKYQKRKKPTSTNEVRENNTKGLKSDGISYNQESVPAQSDSAVIDIVSSSDNELPDIVFEDKRNRNKKDKRKKKEKEKKKQDETNIDPNPKNVTDTVTDTVSVTGCCSWIAPGEEERNTDDNLEHLNDKCDPNVELIEICERGSKEFQMSSENWISSQCPSPQLSELSELTSEDMLDIPDCVLWPSIFTGFDSCSDFDQLVKLVDELKDKIPPIGKRIPAVYSPDTDRIDEVAQKEIPPDGPTHLCAVHITGDGNCLCRALSKAYFNDDGHHIELRARIVIEGVKNMQKYLSDDYLERGATWTHSNADLPTVFSTFSEFFTPGQKITDDTIQCIYCLEMHSCSHLGGYMGLWQLAQSATVLKLPIHTIYPCRGKSTLRNDFHRIFFPVEYTTTCNDDDPIAIMWTGLSMGAAPVHFVTLLQHINDQ